MDILGIIGNLAKGSGVIADNYLMAFKITCTTSRISGATEYTDYKQATNTLLNSVNGLDYIKDEPLKITLDGVQVDFLTGLESRSKPYTLLFILILKELQKNQNLVPIFLSTASGYNGAVYLQNFTHNMQEGVEHLSIDFIERPFLNASSDSLEGYTGEPSIVNNSTVGV